MATLTRPTHTIYFAPHLDSASWYFDPISRELREGEPALVIRRLTRNLAASVVGICTAATNILFKNKGVSRAHAEVWVEDPVPGSSQARFFIRDTKSKHGTFVNQRRLSPANTESDPYPIMDGDILQLGTDSQGVKKRYTESVKIRIELKSEHEFLPQGPISSEPRQRRSSGDSDGGSSRLTIPPSPALSNRSSIHFNNATSLALRRPLDNGESLRTVLSPTLSNCSLHSGAAVYTIYSF
ncbi:hypothetical protein C8R43DRAFT_402766 [Mycena crocata]|nr:hypothetical protein C8R43DRAFT_402766 [Mycena crocata]